MALEHFKIFINAICNAIRNAIQRYNAIHINWVNFWKKCNATRFKNVNFMKKATLYALEKLYFTKNSTL